MHKQKHENCYESTYYNTARIIYLFVYLDL